MEIINSKIEINYLDTPYPIWIIDNFLKSEIIDTIIAEWPDMDDHRWHRGHEKINGNENILERGMRGISKTEQMPKNIGKILKTLHSKEFTHRIGEILEIDELIPDEYMRWSGMRTMIPDSFQLIHSDARTSPESSLRKELTCLIYLNSGYDRERDEGCLEVWNDDMTEKIHEIEPLLNRMTVFLNTDRSYHGVPLVKGERRAITFSIMKSGESSSRTKALFVPRPEDSEDVRIEGINRSKIKDARGY